MTGTGKSATEKAATKDVERQIADIKKMETTVTKANQQAANSAAKAKDAKMKLKVMKKELTAKKAEVKNADTTATSYTMKKCSCGVEFQDENNKDGSPNQVIKNCPPCRQGKKKAK